ncbi:hypothetical protein V6N11_056021 [Hibiscus sabdariffa]|uniref:Small nuclear ribonucleoprotein E n=2 Tax=Hibiscus sabdariffa TaxID=183260 RepID=A0ABR2T3A3_9ROSI
MPVCQTMPHMRGEDYIQHYRISGVVFSLRPALARPIIFGVVMTQPVWATVASATLLHGDFLAANDNAKKLRSKSLLSSPTWLPPPPGAVDISINGAFIQSHGAGIGVVTRDSAGRVLGGLAQHSAAPGPSALAEAAAVLAGLHLASMASTKVQRIMTQPINLIFRFLQSKARIQIWLFEQKDLRIEGRIIGFDEYMNLVLDDAEEVNIKKKSRKTLGRILLKGDNITLMMNSGK